MTSRVAEAVNGFSVKNVVLATTGIVGGSSVIVAIADIIKSDPALSKMAAQTITQWGPLFVLFAAVLYLNDRRFGQFISNQNESQKAHLDVQRDHAAAQQKMADAVHRLAERDYERQRETELVVGHMARDAARNRQLLEEIHERLNQIQEEKAHGHHAG